MNWFDTHVEQRTLFIYHVLFILVKLDSFVVVGPVLLDHSEMNCRQIRICDGNCFDCLFCVFLNALFFALFT